MNEKFKTMKTGSGGMEGYVYEILFRVSLTGEIGCSNFVIHDNHKNKVRSKDRQWFKKHIPNIIKDKQIHHDWENGERCYVLSPMEHAKLEGRRR